MVQEHVKKQFHKETFDNIPESKREKIIAAALEEFAAKGLDNAKIDNIAKKAGISYGSMYTYFTSKDDLIHTIIRKGFDMQREVMMSGLMKGGTFERIESILRLSQKVAMDNPGIISLWVEMSFSHNERFSNHLFEMEAEGTGIWKEIINDGKKSGEIPADVDTDAAAYILDSIVSNLMKAHISNHEMKKITNDFPASDIPNGKHIDSLMPLIKSILGTGSSGDR